MARGCHLFRSEDRPQRRPLVGSPLLYCLIATVCVAGQSSTVVNTTDVEQTGEGKNLLVCPSSTSRPIFTLPCKTDADCKVLGEQCCDEDGKSRCMKGVPKPSPEPTHSPFLGIIPQECPKNPVPERLPIKNCTTDRECWPRICCPDGPSNYCRTPLPKWQQTPRLESLKDLVAYLQCTTPPLLDLFPKPCKNIADCFPNLCCQEKDKRVCRPPKKSMLALLAMVTQRFGSG